ncbi:LacI family DNA-binding transcriptional regulator [Salibacterium qingdaonense]|uniref:Transcriptional regulator, LacI family n=1 Tax=Salibacterium qingdaonense TaxID=266892 RepID=A0A1I4NWU1_9BACI|nr:LacI family DNA-binding transcriptional regulator [Salibacterium qingdaonense]SFM20024.1 transcriptional regulator, LacI family [Salibacterium qingdaonense]
MKHDKNVTIADVAKHAGISKSTVSQYLNKRFEYMGEETKQRIRQSIAALGYSPNVLARSLKQKKTFTIGMIVANILHGFSTQVIRTVEDACNEQDIHVIVCNTDEDPQKEQKYVQMLEAKQVDGFIIFPAGDNEELYRELLDKNIPLVFVDRIVPDLPVNTVLTDNEKAAAMAVDYFTNCGHRRIGLAVPPLKRVMTPRSERLSGFQKAMESHELEKSGMFIYEQSLSAMADYLSAEFQKEDKPTALLASNDLTLIEVLQFCRQQEMEIGRDVSIISIDDMPLAGVYNPAVTSIEQPAAAIGEKAAELLFEEMNEGKELSPAVHRYSPVFLERDSVETR